MSQHVKGDKKMKNKKNKMLILMALILALGVLAACDDGESLSSEEAAAVYSATSQAVGEATSEVMTLAMSGSTAKLKAEDDWTFGDDGGFNGTVEGPNGGSATVTGSGTFSEDSYEFSFTITFNAYVTTTYVGSEMQEITLDGSVEYAYSGTQTTYTADYTGSVTATGAVEGTANFDLHIEMSQGSISISGTVGGQEVGGSYEY
eukprot:Anaeramoba_ignava/a101983_5.p1 GENE.a101983_5~~a101983_5.p1  ORF type:complete len:204 (-),score=-13.67 a101983_5:23-634(-)